MRETGCFLLLLLSASFLHAQTPQCARFEGPSLEGWTAVNSTATLVAGDGRKYVDLRDGSGASNFVAPAAFTGNWLQRSGGCGSFCFDVSVLDDGLPTSNAVRPYFVISDAAGHSATFQPTGIVEGSGWQTVCAPIGPLANGRLPNQGDGTWSFGANTTAADWVALLQNVQTLRLAVDFAGSAAVSERLLLDELCMRPRSCEINASKSQIVQRMELAQIPTNWPTCPKACQRVEHYAGDTYNVCTWGRTGPANAPMVAYVPGTRDNKNCLYAGDPLDVEKRHRLFVHGIHSNQFAWSDWVQRVEPQMTYLGYKTVSDNTGYTAEFGEGTSSLLTQVNELAAQINAGFANVPDGEVWVYAHSLGALKVEALLQLGYSQAPGGPLHTAARKLGQIYVFQGAHGGCAATLLNGDYPNHGLKKSGCPASKDIGLVNDSKALPPSSRPIPGSSTVWNMSHVLWLGRGVQEKRITYVVATSKGGKTCTGEKKFICADNRVHDGAVYADQMTPPYAGFAEAMQSGHVRVVEEIFYCHASGDIYDPPRLSNELRKKYIGLESKVYEYFVALPEEKKTYTVTTDVVKCEPACFCGAAWDMACSTGIDCTRYDSQTYPPRKCLPTSQPPVTGGGMDLWLRTTYTGIWFTGWVPCAKEGEVCKFTGRRQVRYGADPKFAIRVVDGSTPCTNAVFGDPSFGVAKTCEYNTDPVLDPTTPPMIYKPDVQK